MSRSPIRFVVLIAVLAGVAISVANAGAPKLTIGAVYPTGGTHSRGGIDEFRGVELAVEYVNSHGGVGGRQVEIAFQKADSGDEAPRAVHALAEQGIQVILGSYGSTISRPAAAAARASGVMFWETGAVGDLSMESAADPLVFRFPPTGETLGKAAVDHAFERALPALDQQPKALRYGVTYVDDSYGASVGVGAVAALRSRGVEPSGIYPYLLANMDMRRLVSKMKQDRIQVLFVSSYLSDGIELRRQTVDQNLNLVASLGTSSSYCMHEFGEALGKSAVGLFASDKPDGHVLDPKRLEPTAGEQLVWARDLFKERYSHEMTAPALTGFAGALALLEHVIPQADSEAAAAISDAAREVEIKQGELPNGSGMDFAKGSSENRRATSVIWQWVAPGVRAVVHPPAFATQPALPLPIA